MEKSFADKVQLMVVQSLTAHKQANRRVCGDYVLRRRTRSSLKRNGFVLPDGQTLDLDGIAKAVRDGTIWGMWQFGPVAVTDVCGLLVSLGYDVSDTQPNQPSDATDLPGVS